MKKKITSQKSFIVILFLLIIIIYGNLFFKVNKTLNKPQTSENDIILPDSTSEDISFSISFQGKYKDPFRLTVPKVTKEKETKTPKDEITKIPMLTLQGIVGKTAIVKYKNELYFLEDGDSLFQFTILKVYNDSVRYNIKNKTIISKFTEWIES